MLVMGFLRAGVWSKAERVLESLPEERLPECVLDFHHRTYSSDPFPPCPVCPFICPSSMYTRQARFLPLWGRDTSNSKQTTKNYNCDKCHEWKIWPEISLGGGAAMGWPALGWVIREASKGRCWLS